MSMKALVNSPDVHEAFLTYIKSIITVRQKSLEQATEMSSVYRLQGQITELRRMLNVRDEINYKDK